MKERRIVKHAQAMRDLGDCSEYIRRHNPRAALRFLDAAEATFRLLAAQPGMGVGYDPDHPALAGIRFFPITRFKNYLIFYLPSRGGIEILRVLHGAQDIHHILAEQFGIDDEGDPDEGD